MAEVQHLPELKLLALLDEELSRAEAAAARSHLTRCFSCHRLYEGLRRESDVLRAAAAPEVAREREVSRELGWVVAAGLVLSLGLVAVRRFFIGASEAAAETPMPDALPVLSDLGFRLLSLLDIQQIGLQIAYGGIVIMTLIGIALASNAIRRPRAGVMPLLLAAVIPGLGALGTPAEALEVIAGESARCRIAPEQVVDDDLLLLCDEAAVAGTVRGDLYFAGRALIISGRVDGDVFGFGNELIVDGSVGLSLRGAAQTVRIAGDLGRGLAAGGERVSILAGATVGGGVMIAGDRLSVAGPVGGSVLAGGSRLEVNAPIEGDLKFSGEELHLGSGASIGGDAHYTGPSEPEREPGAPNVEWSEPEPEETSVWDEGMRIATRWAMGLALGLVLVLLASGPLGAMAAIGGRPIAPLLLGLLLFVGVPFAAILLAITFIGLPLAFAIGALYLFLLYASRLVAAMVIGQAILGLASTNVQRVGRIALGLGVLALAVEVPFIGGVVGLLVAFFGLGAFGLWLWRSRRPAVAS
ncbi:MAG: hypothetical protein OXI45_01840 [Acidobacteriota bacterium]|nr:hypothetical protein [Acidobacteriota bacterium]